jgi:HEAT repeat protein
LGREFSQISANSQEFREEIVLLIIGRLGDNDAFVRGSAIAALGIIVANNQEYQAELVPLIERSLDG